MEFTEKNILKIVADCEKELKSNKKIKFSFDKKLSDNFPKKAGVYAIFYKEKLAYFGQTANLKERMKEVKRTYNHTFRRKLGKYIDKNAVVLNGKFDEKLEEKLNEHYIKHLTFTYKEVNFGRLEISLLKI